MSENIMYSVTLVRVEVARLVIEAKSPYEAMQKTEELELKFRESIKNKLTRTCEENENDPNYLFIWDNIPNYEDTLWNVHSLVEQENGEEFKPSYQDIVKNMDGKTRYQHFKTGSFFNEKKTIP